MIYSPNECYNPAITLICGVIGINGERMTDAELGKAYEKYRDMVYRLSLAGTKDRARAEDIQQDVFMALVKYSDRIRSEEHLKAWLIKVTQNACRKHFRSLWIKLGVSYDDALDKNAEGEVSSPEEEVERAEDIYLVRENVEKLNQKQREIIHLFYYEEMKIKQIASCLGISEQNAKTRLSRARDELRRLMN